jgi:uncharacterized UPF0160 family protein
MMKIGTHNGVFHCDEALACAILKTLPRFKDAKIIRTRDQVKLLLIKHFYKYTRVS